MTPEQLRAVANKLRTPRAKIGTMPVAEGYAAILCNRLAEAIEEVADE